MMNNSSFGDSMNNSNNKIKNISFEKVRLSSMLRHEMQVESNQKNHLLDALKKSLFTNTLFNGSMCKFKDNDFTNILNDSSLAVGGILKNELATQKELFDYEEEHRTIPADFNLYEYIKNDKNKEIDHFMNAEEFKIRKLNQRERKRAIRKYLNKKEKRRDLGSIRYHIRKDLAIKRKRHKGKFVRNKRIDLKAAAKEFHQDMLEKELNLLKFN